MADDDVHQRIASLEQQVEDLRGELATLNKQLVEAQLDEWKGRVDELELQAHLARMNVSEQIGPLVEQLRDRLLDAREQLGKAGGQAGDLLGSLRDGVQQAADDLRTSIRNAIPTGG